MFMLTEADARVTEPSREAPHRSPGGRILFVENFRAIQPGMWNDGVGSASRDCDVMFNGRPTLRLDPQGQANSGATNPGRTAATSGVVVKRRIHDGFHNRIGLEAWFRLTSTNLTTNTFFSMSIYNRDGTYAYHGRVWLDPNGVNQPLVARILDGTATATAAGPDPTGAATYYAAATSALQTGGGSHTYDPSSGRCDRAGGWHWVKLVVDFTTKKYVGLYLDGEAYTDLSTYSLDTTTSTGFAGLHLSFELSASTSTRPRYVNIANVVCTQE